MDIVHGEDENVPTFFIMFLICAIMTVTTITDIIHGQGVGCAVTLDPPKWPGVFVTAGTIFGAPGGSHSWGIATARARNGSWRDCTCHLGDASFSETLQAHPKTWIRLQEF